MATAVIIACSLVGYPSARAAHRSTVPLVHSAVSPPAEPLSNASKVPLLCVAHRYDFSRKTAGTPTITDVLTAARNSSHDMNEYDPSSSLRIRTYNSRCRRAAPARFAAAAAPILTVISVMRAQPHALSAHVQSPSCVLCSTLSPPLPPPLLIQAAAQPLHLGAALSATRCTTTRRSLSLAASIKLWKLLRNTTNQASSCDITVSSNLFSKYALSLAPHTPSSPMCITQLYINGARNATAHVGNGVNSSLRTNGCDSASAISRQKSCLAAIGRLVFRAWPHCAYIHQYISAVDRWPA